MAEDIIAAFDIGPLSWVKPEIDHSLAEARKSLDRAAADPGDAKPLKYVATHLHQVAGALAMVGLGAATRFCEEIEKVVALLEQKSGDPAALTAVIRKGIAALGGYLDRLLAGRVDRPMVLAPVYVELNRARDATDAAESDLFYPDLTVTLPAPEHTVVLPTRSVQEQILRQRRGLFHSGLLKLLKEKDYPAGLRAMRDAVQGIESLQIQSPNRTFWFTASAFFDALAHGHKGLDTAVVSLLGKIDQQIRLLQEGVQKVPERLFRDLLLVIGRGNARSDRVNLVRLLYRLDDQLATTEAHGGNASEELRLVVRELHELTQAQKESWLRFTSGNRAAIEAFALQAINLVNLAAKQPSAELVLVFKALANVAGALRAAAVAPPESVALEVATALLFTEGSLENYFMLSDDFTEQARTVAMRVMAALSGVAPPVLDSAAAGLMDDMTRRAQERLLIFQVGQEIQVNLQGIEQVLDAFFRDPLKTAQLPSLEGLFSQVQGALAILELDEATALNRLIAQRVTQFARGARKCTDEDAEAVAEGISALGLYVSELQQGRTNPRDVLLPALVRYGLAEKPLVLKASGRIASMVSDSDIEVQKQKAQELYQEWKQQPEATHTRDQLKQVVADLKRDAELVSDHDVAKQSGEALSLLEHAVDPSKTGLFEALEVIAPESPAVQVEPPEPQVVRLLEKENAEIDAELLGIFLEEATEVVATINENLDIARTSPQDREALITIRRGFHTLKGSGRMVGLTDLGEVAWQAEQVMNKWLKDEKLLTSALLRFIALCAESFSGWVSSLQNAGNVPVDGSQITRLADAFKNDREPDFGIAAAATPVAQELSPLVESPSTAAVPVESEAVFESVSGPEEVSVALPEMPPAMVEEEVQVGDVRMSAALFSIYQGEAQQHAVDLNKEMCDLEAHPLTPVTHAFMRAAHTLNSSSRTTGFQQIADVAHALEKWLQQAIDILPEFNAQRLDLTRRAVDALTMMVADLREQNTPLPRQDVVDELTALREQLSEARHSGEGTHLRRPRLFTQDEAESPAAEAPAAIEISQSASVDLAPAAHAVPEEPHEAVSAAAEQPAAAPIQPEPLQAIAIPVVQHVTPVPVAEVVESGRDKRRIQDDIDKDLLPIFLEEAREIVPQVGNALRRWRTAPADRTPAADLSRHLHTLKGSARMAGLMRLGELAHVLETKVIALAREATPAVSAFDGIDDYFDRFTGSLDHLQRGEDIGELIDIPVTEVFEQSKDKPATIALMAAAAQAVRDEVSVEGHERQALLRVNADLIDRFVNEAGELAIARSRIDIELGSFKRALLELNDSVTRMKQQLREIEIQAETQIQSQLKEREEHTEAFDPLEFDRFTRMQEVARSLTESLGDVVTLQQGLQKNLDETDAALLQQGRLNRDLQQGLMGVRLVPLGNLQDRLHRIVRQTAKEIGKKANLEFRGARVELDRSVLEKITAPFEHLLRNAVSHGLESPSQRVASGKSEIGEISIDANQVGNEVVLTVSDDGAGLDYARIRAKAIAGNLLDANAQIGDEQLVQYIFMSGFTTAEEVTQISGRGVGMDVVRSEIVSLGGRIEIRSTPGKGTAFIITMPLTLAVTQAVMVKIGEDLFAIPSVLVEQVQEYKGKKYDPLLEMNEIEWKGNRYPLRSLDGLLGGSPVASAQKRASVILARSGGQRAAVQVDEIIGNREIVVKPIGPQLSRLSGIAGATVLGNGQVVLILNPVQLVNRESKAAEKLPDVLLSPFLGAEPVLAGG